MTKVFKVLVIMPTLDKCGGIERFYINYYKHMSDKFKVDFITHHTDSETYQKIIKEKGGSLFVMPKLGIKTMPTFIKKVKKFFEEHHDYDIIHCNMANACLFYFKEAKKYGIKTRILHSHECRYAGTTSHAIRNYFLINLGKRLATYRFACGHDAGVFLFGKDFTVINNAIEYNDFKFSKKDRDEIRKKYKIKDDEFLIGHVGRMAPVKNQTFLIDLVKNINNKKLKLLIIGDGELRNDLINQINELNLNDSVKIVDSTDMITKYYCAFDMFVLPSHYEGLPLVGIEAQANGLPCIYSTNVTKELQISDEVYFLPLELDAWTDKINEYLDKGIDRHGAAKLDKKFDVVEQTKQLEENYIKAYKKCNGE